MTASHPYRRDSRLRSASRFIRAAAMRLALVGTLFSSALPFGQALPASDLTGRSGALIICSLLVQLQQSRGDRDTPSRDNGVCPVCSVLAADRGASPAVGPQITPPLLVETTHRPLPATPSVAVERLAHDRQPRAPPGAPVPGRA